VVAHPHTGNPAGILIVEDKTLAASFIGAMVGISGFRVVGIAASGPEALFLAAETRPALALVDLLLNGPPDGAALACLLHDRLAVPAIFLSGIAVDQDILRRANAARPLGFIRTPCTPSRIFNAVERGLTQAAAGQAGVLRQAS
jgi:DNA-binding NarL/FixJ family response regulator